MAADGNDTVDAGFDERHAIVVRPAAGMTSLDDGNEGNDTTRRWRGTTDIIFGDVSPDNPDFALYCTL